jgi:hypothetical protein
MDSGDLFRRVKELERTVNELREEHAELIDQLGSVDGVDCEGVRDCLPSEVEGSRPPDRPDDRGED